LSQAELEVLGVKQAAMQLLVLLVREAFIPRVAAAVPLISTDTLKVTAAAAVEAAVGLVPEVLVGTARVRITQVSLLEVLVEPAQEAAVEAERPMIRITSVVLPVEPVEQG
jgi:hypothetical protein